MPSPSVRCAWPAAGWSSECAPPPLPRYQFYLDDLPIWGMVGELTSSEEENEEEESEEGDDDEDDGW